jgi:hypothetical protein
MGTALMILSLLKKLFSLIMSAGDKENGIN